MDTNFAVVKNKQHKKTRAGITQGIFLIYCVANHLRIWFIKDENDTHLNWFFGRICAERRKHIRFTIVRENLLIGAIGTWKNHSKFSSQHL